jgi:NAD(P)-dependent dehydrogenase (short-subunit alcohol dehydrogenase family)
MRTVLITGASGGIGSATTRRLDGLGWRVFAGVRGNQAAERLGMGANAVIPVELDICDARSIAHARAEVARHLEGKGLDALVNNAGLSVQGPVEMVPAKALRHQFDVNVIGHVEVTQAFLPMLRLAQGRVINVGGAAGRLALPMQGGLSASKAALDSLTDALRMELKFQGVLVCYIEPGALKTQFFQKAAASASRDRDQGSDETRQIYARAIKASTRALASSRTGPVEDGVNAIVKALTVKRPAARYLVGRDARLGLLLLRHFPHRLRDRVLMSNLRLTPETFGLAGAGPAKAREPEA